MDSEFDFVRGLVKAGPHLKADTFMWSLNFQDSTGLHAKDRDRLGPLGLFFSLGCFRVDSGRGCHSGSQKAQRTPSGKHVSVFL